MSRQASTKAFARTASAASVLEPRLLRALRRELHPGLDAGAEADLLLSGLMAPGTGRFLRFRDDVLAELRARLRDEIVQEQRSGGRSRILDGIRAAVTREHAAAPVTVRMHDELLLEWLETGRADGPEIQARLGSVLQASFDADRPGVARWAAQLFAGLPSPMQAASPGQALRLMAGVRDDGGAPPDAQAFRRLLPHALKNLPKVLVGVKVLGGAIELRDGPVLPAGFLCFEVPGSEPRYLEVEQAGVPERLALPVGGRVRHPVTPGPVLLRDGVGQRWELSVDSEAGEEGGICWVSWGGKPGGGARALLEEMLAGHGWQVGERERAGLVVVMGSGDSAAQREDVQWAEGRGVPVLRLAGVGGDPRRTEVELGRKLRLLRSPDVLDYGPVLAAHEGLVPRRELSAVLRRSVMEETRVGVVGGTGTGKTALLAELVRDLAAEDDVVVCPVFLTRDAPFDDDEAARRSLHARLDAVHGASGLSLGASWGRAARVLREVKQRLVVAIDGFDGVPAWLPERGSGVVSVVVSGTRSGEGDRSRRSFDSEGWVVWELEDRRWERETRAAMAEMVESLPGVDRYVSGRVRDAILSIAGPSFGALRSLLRWLELGGHLDSTPPEGTGADAVLGFARGWFQTFAPDQALVLAALAAAREPLTLAQVDRVLRAADITASLNLGAHPEAPPDLPVLALCDELPGEPARYRVSWPREVASQLPPSPRLHSALADTLGRWPAPWGAPQEEVEYALRHRDEHLEIAGREDERSAILADLNWLAGRAALGDLGSENRELIEAFLGEPYAPLRVWLHHGQDPLALASVVAKWRARGIEADTPVTFPERAFLHVRRENPDRAPEAPASLPLQGGHYFMGGFLHTWADREWRRLALAGDVENERLHAPVTAAADGVLGFEDASLLLLNETGGTRIHVPSKARVTAVSRVGSRILWGDDEGAVWQGERVEQLRRPNGSAITAVASLGNQLAWADAAGRVEFSSLPAFQGADGSPLHWQAPAAHGGAPNPVRSVVLNIRKDPRRPEVVAGCDDGTLLVGHPDELPITVRLGRRPLTIAHVGQLSYDSQDQVCVAFSSTTVYVSPLWGSSRPVVKWRPHGDDLRDVVVQTASAGLQILTAGGDGRVGIWEMDGTSRGWLTGQTSAVGGIQVTSDDRLLAWCEDGSVHRWSLSDRSLLAVLGDGAPRWLDIKTGPASAMAESQLVPSQAPRTPYTTAVLTRRHVFTGREWHRRADEDLLLFVSDGDARVEVTRGLVTVRWGTASGEWRGSIHASTTAAAFSPSRAAEPAFTQSTAVSPPPRLLARGDRGGVVHLHRLVDGKVEEPLAQSIALATESVRALRFLPGGETLLAAGDLGGLVLLDLPESASEPSPLRLTQRGDPWRGHTLAIRAIDARDTDVITASDDRTARIWDPATGGCRLILRHPAAVTGCALLAEVAVTACADGRVRVWGTDRGALLDVFLCDAPPTVLGRLPDDSLLVACRDGQSLVLEHREPDSMPPARIVGDQLIVRDGHDAGRLVEDASLLRQTLVRAADRLANEPYVGSLVVRTRSLPTPMASELARVIQATFSSRLPHIALRFETTANPEGPSLTFWLER